MSLPQVLADFFFVLHWKRGRAGSCTPRRARIVVSTFKGMIMWPWHRLDLHQSLHSPKQLLGFLFPSRMSLLWWSGHPVTEPQQKQFAQLVGKLQTHLVTDKGQHQRKKKSASFNKSMWGGMTPQKEYTNVFSVWPFKRSFSAQNTPCTSGQGTKR